MPTFTPRQFALLVLLATPAVLAAQATQAPKTPAAAVEEFMRALADSNLPRMAELWGNSKGPAARTHMPKEYEKQIVIMQSMLHGVQARALGDVPSNKAGMRTVTTQLAHNGCMVTIPVNVVRAKEGWLVHDFDLVQASVVNRPCDTSRRPGNSPE